MEMLRKLVPVEVKELGDRQLEIAGSTEDVDRMGDVIKSSGWKLGPFKKNPVFMWAHDYNKPPIGRALKVWVDKETKRLMFNVEFAGPDVYEFADTIYKLYKGGFLHATSVGFIPLNWEGKDDENPNPKWEGNVFTSQELLELSAVPVPANANALASARDQGLITVKEFDALCTAAKYTCECIECGHTLETDKHCRDIECPKCGGEMRRQERPGPGQESITKPEETEDTIRIPVKAEEGKHKDHDIKTIDIDKDKGIKALYCVECKVIITYLFDKDNDEDWTMASAQEWVDEHAKSFTLVDVTAVGDTEPHFAIRAELPGMEAAKPAARAVSQQQILDDIDYVRNAIEQAGLSDAALPVALQLASDIIQRSMGNDIPTDILTKVGAVLNAKNKGRLTQIQQLAQEVLDSAATPDDSDKQLEPAEHTPDPAELLQQRALDVAEVAQLVIAKLKGKRIY